MPPRKQPAEPVEATRRSARIKDQPKPEPAPKKATKPRSKKVAAENGAEAAKGKKRTAEEAAEGQDQLAEDDDKPQSKKAKSASKAPASKPTSKVATSKPSSKAPASQSKKPASKPASAKGGSKPASKVKTTSVIEEEKENAGPEPIAEDPAEDAPEPVKEAAEEEAREEAKEDEPTTAAPASKVLEVGDVLPTITVKNEKGDDVNVAELAAEKGVVLFLVPKADTPGCNTQACGFRDIYGDFSNVQYDVYAVSNDTAAAQSKWKTKKELPYSLLSDPKRELIAALGAKSGVTTKRSHVVVEKGGKILDKKIGVKPAESPKLALEFIQGLAAST